MGRQLEVHIIFKILMVEMMYNVVEKSENNFRISLIFKILNGLQKP
jgi:hypothetical protein